MSGLDSQNMSSEPSLALPAPAADPSAEPRTDGKTQMNVDGKSVPLDHLGPMIINTNGVRSLTYKQYSSTQHDDCVYIAIQTISRITNWLDMTENEQQRTLQLLMRRNRVRLAAQKPEEGEALGIVEC
ncbi:hypothetical protein PENSPDRAFT_690028 [Peniophora sp. CONT]|nr:hypothetical protein PENSPDRAFT_690028 [Peniophora sp. CONT]